MVALVGRAPESVARPAGFVRTLMPSPVNRCYGIRAKGHKPMAGDTANAATRRPTTPCAPSAAIPRPGLQIGSASPVQPHPSANRDRRFVAHGIAPLKTAFCRLCGQTRTRTQIFLPCRRRRGRFAWSRSQIRERMMEYDKWHCQFNSTQQPRPK